MKNLYSSNFNSSAMLKHRGLSRPSVHVFMIIQLIFGISTVSYGKGLWNSYSYPPVELECLELCCISFPSAVSDCHDFENYSLGNLVPQASPVFTLFSSQSGDAAVSNLQHYSGTKSIRFGNTSDINYNLFVNITQVARLEWMTYIPSGKGGAFGFYTNNSGIYPLYVKYNNGVATMYKKITSSTSEEIGTFSYPANTWMKTVLIFFPGDKIEYWQDGTLRYTIPDYLSNQIGHLNFYYNNNASSSEFFIDDICYKESVGFIICSDDYNPVCVNGQEFTNECYAQSAGYSECEWVWGACGTIGCNPCNECFVYLPRYQTTNTIDFLNHYCEEFIPTFQEDNSRASTTEYFWEVQNANVQFANGTTAGSENPSIIFPGPGTYTVCQNVFVGGNLVFDCCRTIVIGGCNTSPVAFYTSQFFPFNDVFKLTTNPNGNQVRWSFSEPVTYWSGNEFSSSPEIQVPFGKCIIACLYVTNACGTSSYCTELCFNDPGCTGTTPPVYINSAIVPEVDNKTIEINLPAPSGGGSATYAWDFGDGNFGSSEDISHTYDEYGNYNICVVITIGCRTWCYCWCIRLNPCTTEYTYNEGLIDIEFTGSETNLQYTFSALEPKAPGESWLVDNEPVSGSSSTLVYTFPSAGNYTVCFPYLGNDGCIHYHCIDVGAGNPFNCNIINWTYSATSGFRFNIPSGATEVSWTIDETGQAIGQNITSNWVLPTNPCTWRTISVRYFDGIRYRICCLRVYLCLPDECYGSIDYGYLSSTDQATFSLNVQGSDFNWYFDDTPTQSLGTGSAIQIPYPGTCLSRWISVRYKDVSGRWRLCCRLIYFCNPIACNNIRVHYNENTGYTFSVAQAYQNMSWILEETGTSLGTGLTSSAVALGSTCEYRTVSLRYWIPGLGWQLCCIRFYHCNPVSCGDLITTSSSNNLLLLQAPDHLQNITWYENNTVLGNANPITTTLSANTSHNICIRYFDVCDNSWKWCCKNYTPGNSNSDLTFDIDNNICGASQQIIEIPVRVRGFNNIANFQFSLQIDDPAKGELIEITKKDISGDFLANVINAGSGAVAWENLTPVSLPDNTIIAMIRIRILSTSTGESLVRITDTPTEIVVENGTGESLIPLIYDGSFCFVHLVDVCGRITREDQLPIGNVTVSLNGCRRYVTTTDAAGNYCFRDVPADATYEVKASKDTNYKNGVNAGDLSSIKRHILTIQRLNSPYKILAADGKRDSRVNVGDVSELRRLILGIIPDLPTTKSWLFADKKYVFPVPTDPFQSVWPEGVLLQNIQSDISDADMIGWKTGDVDLSNNPGLTDEQGELNSRSQEDIYLFASSHYVPGIDSFTVDITTKNFTNMLAAQFSITWDSSKFRVVSSINHHPALNLASDNFYINQERGRMGFIWSEANPVTLPDDAKLFSLRVVPLVNPVGSSQIEFGEDPVEYYFQNGDGEEVNVIVSSGNISVATSRQLEDEFLLYPNPNSGTFQILGLDGHVELEVIDSRGVVVMSRSGLVGAIKEIRIEETGMYFVRIIAEGRTYYEKVLVTGQD